MTPPKLDRELHDRIETGSASGMSFIRHPLVCTLYLSDHDNERLNMMLAWKKDKLNKLLAANDFEGAVWLYERPFRFPAFQKYASLMSDGCYWTVLSGVWTDSENIWQNFDEWVQFWSSKRQGQETVMDQAEWLAYQALPEVVTVYRGTERGRKLGMSWTLSRKRAEWFAKRFQRRPLVVTGTVAKRHVLAVFHGRNEDEVVVLPRHVKQLQREELK